MAIKKKMNFIKRIFRNLKRFYKDDDGSSMVESGLLIALSLFLFLMLIGMVTNIYSWIESKFTESLQFLNG